ncbi:twin-arginine translocase TatA/TatE family subunit [Corynebacterium glucuronolyticum]|uniref:Sec-independent protein translocase protein TatB n=2 Tax=Corynebacterium glucuronolyticum TaxID=39791 RepID=A0A7T4EEQ7_9CORY|nr:twin-arginine translocase TatA/TatE family subunit [Corynebacterium glucuronolyticum]EEI62712.1 twin arginine-targeting protein translocase TatB [Corynebacterium glucuronolyticum ATCC 51866]QQB46024.1 Sec-independent protein translocase TatB [Corynebacterium glucuronolyticum]QRP71464.1 Sec-independent protein translocase TatB [Corynebacterium glucuronolyticum]WKD63238.1 sec-independent translocase [Corynebacterium glucuronolyticum DSM 44120]SMB77445.1 sec-independent protein translocase pro
MFNDVGWVEILIIFIVAVFLIGPEKIPKAVEDIKAAILAARNAINRTKMSLSDDLGPEFDEFRKPLGELAKLRAMGPKAALTKTLFDGDDTYLDALDPKKFWNDTDPASVNRASAPTRIPDAASPSTPGTQGEASSTESPTASTSKKPSDNDQTGSTRIGREGPAGTGTVDYSDVL